MSHIIDFHSHGHHKKWNGHWSYNDFLWRIMRGNRPYFINRECYSTHLELLTQINFKILSGLKKKDISGIKRNELSHKYKKLIDQDINTCYAFILSKKEGRYYK